MRYYLVALFDNESYLSIEELQKNLCKKYRLYKSSPALHITLEIIGNPDIDKLNKILTDILKPYKKFRVQINGAMCFNPPYKSITLNIENRGYIIRLARQINETLKLYGFEVTDSIENLDLHINLANTNFAVREWSADEYSAACETAKKEEVFKMAKIDRIELWKSTNNKKDMIVKSYLLREF